MKTLNILFIAITAITLGSCAEQKVTYSLDKEKSSLTWKGMTDPSYFHYGSVKITEGSIEMEGEKLVGGTFSIDLKTIKVEDDLPQKKKDYLAEHLMDTSFFFVAKYPVVKVKVNGYENGKLSTVINVRGIDIKQEIPVKLKKDKKSVRINGKFDVDFSALNMAGTQPEEGSEEHVLPVISYELDLVLNKK